MLTKSRATIEDLYREPGKAELVNGEIVRFMATGGQPGRAGGWVFASLLQYEKGTQTGRAYPDNVGFRVHLPDRESFSPDAAFHTGPPPDMKFVDGAPVFAAEIRSENDYGPVAENEMEEKRRDYFAAGTQVVWDVDLQGQDVVRKFVAPDHARPAATFGRGETADAEEALPGWRLPVDDLFG